MSLPPAPYSLRLRFPRLPRLQSDTFGNKYARNRYRKEWHREVWAEVLAAGGKPSQPLDRAFIRCVRYSSAKPDEDNLYYSFKPLIDGLKQCGVIAEDNPDVVKREVEWSRTPGKQGYVTIEVTSRSAKDASGGS